MESAGLADAGSGAPQVFIKRVRQPRGDEALRVLVDRLWPRGVSKEVADVDMWPQALAPSTQLRRAVHGGDMSFEEFAAVYARELRESVVLQEFIATIRGASGSVALLISTHPEKPNHADVLKGVLDRAMRAS